MPSFARPGLHANPNWSFRTTNPLNVEELLGALTVQVKIERKLVDYWGD